MKKKNPFFYLVFVSQLGLYMVLPIVISVYIGKIIDGYLDTAPYISIILLVLGIISSFNNLFKLIKKERDKDRKE